MAEPLQYDLEVLLPGLGGHPDDHCAQRLIDAVAGSDGVSDAHIVRDPPGTTRLCLHLAPEVTDIVRIRDLVRAAGAELSQRYGHLLWAVSGVNHATRADALSALLRRHSGVLDASVSPAGMVRIEFDRQSTNESTLRDLLAREGVRVVREPEPPPSVLSVPHARETAPQEGQPPHADHAQHDDGVLGERGELILALIGAGLYVPARLLDWFGDAPTLTTGLYVAAFVVTGIVVGRDTLTSLRARKFEIDLLMLVAAVGAAALGHWSDAALLLVLFSLGHALEGYAMGRAQRAIEGLSDLAPETAHLRRGTDVTEVPVADLVVGDVIVVRPNERISADGIVVLGSSTVDQAPVTGESVPVDKTAFADAGNALSAPTAQVPLHQVFAGTLNGAGALEVVVTRLASQSTLARVVQLLNEAETQTSPTQRLTNTIERIFVPAVLALVALLIVSPVVTGEDFGSSLNRALAVLVAASPCALAIATPSAVLSGVARAARSGVLVKGGGPLEDLATVTVMAFDKTGTLTVGEPELTDVVPFGGTAEGELLAITVAVERTSDHPLARALTGGAAGRIDAAAVPVASEVTAVIGKGVTAVVNDESVWIGNAALFEQETDHPIPAELVAHKDALETRGRTTMVVRHGSRYLGVLGVMDTPRAEAAGAIDALRNAGIERMIMLSGDNQRVAEAVASQVGVPEALGELLPDEKVEAIAGIAADGTGIAMVGDGVNDAPALARATVGIAMGAAGSDVALETADIALMSDQLSRLPFALHLSRRARAKIRQNLVFSLGVVAVLIPATLLGVGIGPAVVAHEGSTLIVVANALLLLGMRDPTTPAPAGPRLQSLGDEHHAQTKET